MVLSLRALSRLTSFAALCAALNAHADLNANIGVTSEYIRDGISQTAGNPALQAGLTLTDDTGLYGGIASSGMERDDDHVTYEHSLFAGFYQPMGDYLAFDLFATRYLYQGDADIDGESYTEGGLRLLINDAVTIGWRETGNYIGSQFGFRTLELGYTWQLNSLSFDFYTAQHRWLEVDDEDYNFFEDTKRDDYWQFRIGANHSYGPWDFRMTLNKTNLKGNYDAGTIIQFAVHRYFNLW
ncbi:MAG: hypothetical protein CMI03_10595 [Oceanospirillaceae bacterium]|uniref:TorF family putative porin n=1 Tax=unclassified Thalassolituus TaxID=2624967 RepID=UPI000C5F0D4C|nr:MULTISPECIES: TorF family putative porin [unclassified Thalassolituus]MAS24968.1 hypothetical protein [Oceanospirillaceae bacterium]MBS53181.1 hypothetical protein [Oceanospirillaceae bacterium]|tara:strand:- start:688 stop:1407 length:720 start_codon:yes stop_codon:yes gene_type:complete